MGDMSHAVQVDGWIFDQKISPSATLNQGDLIEFPSGTDIQRFGLVVTADCDLQKNKHGRLITLVPIVTMATVMERYLLIEQCDRQRAQILHYACQSYGLTAPYEEPLVTEYLRAHYENAGVDDALTIPRLAVQILLHEIDTIYLKQYVELAAAIGVPVKSEQFKNKLTSQLLAKGDLIILPSLAKLGIQECVAWVRHIWQVPVKNIEVRSSSLKADSGQRIARLDSPFRYRVTQVMAQVFSDIGMPDVSNNFSQIFDEVSK